ncbi:death ligand signal enhancer isoform X2 [Rhincodon typus]|uniref:death ligand signal enhancer isoform X2 n=1 Tax=Rhincodon typus TaxID=259920 RepID=UPI00202E56F5|nr:death ligand signal enhancer isoform X2 [Rhincodon typus]
MWRIKAAAGRVFHRWTVTGPSSSLRLPPTHSAEDDVINSPLVSTHSHFKSSSTDSQNGEEREKREKEQNARFCSKQLPRFSGLDAVGWGAAAVVILQFARHLHRQFCHRNGPQESDAALSFSVQSIITSTLGPARINEPLFIKDIQGSLCSGSTSENGQQGDLQREDPNPEEILNQATSNLQGAANSSVSSILNIIGLKNMKAKDYDMAFSYFMVAANQGYSKAQYNVGVCYELGKGTVKDIKKAALYYSYAAAQGHNMAQFRWAQYLLHVKPEKQTRDTQEAVGQLEKAAKSGLKEAQAYLGVFFTKEPHKDLYQAARYLMMASESGDPASHYNLGICYEKGWGVMMDLRQAAELYQKAAALEHADAQCALGVLYQQGLGGLPVSFSKAIELYWRAAHSGSDEATRNLQCLMEDLQIKGSFSFSNEHSVLRSVMSSPCLPSLASPRLPIPQERPREVSEDWGGSQLQAGMASDLTHSWSMGSLHVSPLSNRSLLAKDGRLRSASTICLDHRSEALAGRLASHSGVTGVG